MLKYQFTRYTQLPPQVLRLIKAEFLLNMVNAGFLLILNLYLRNEGYSDAVIANFTSYRFLGILILAFPMGLFIKGRRLQPFFITASFLIPVTSFLVIFSISFHFILLTRIAFLIWGVGLMIPHVCALPFIMRNTPDHLVSEAISLNFATWSFAMIIAGLFITFLKALDGQSLGFVVIHGDEYHALLAISGFSALAIPLFFGLNEATPRTVRASIIRHLNTLLRDTDSWRIVKVLFPTQIIAIGAGLTIPFINLFFNGVFGITSDQFSLMGSATAVLVFTSALLVPVIKRKFGYMVAIILTQGSAIFFLIILSLTELMATLPGIVWVAICCYILRQPLMNMAAPITSELVMKFVGEKNQELISALHASIWSASWFLSAKIFQYLRSLDLPYYKIFLITAGLYTSGVFLYFFVIRQYRREQNQMGRSVD